MTPASWRVSPPNTCPGPHLIRNLLSLGIWDQTRQAVQELGCDLDFLRHQQEEPGLGNDGLGRLASCFMDSLATLESRPPPTAIINPPATPA